MASDVKITISAVDKTKGAFSSLTGAITKVGKIAVLAGGAAAVALGTGLAIAIKKGISAASDLSESMNKVNVVFGDAASEVVAFSKTASTALGMSQQQALEAAGTFGNLFSSMGIGTEVSKDMSTELLTLAADLASFNNIDPTVALEKLRAGLVGEVEPLRTLGVNLSAAAVELKAVELGLVASGEELSASAKAQASYALILEQTTNAQGDFARTSDGLANSQRIMQAQLADVTATFGEAFLPIVEQVTGFIVTNVMPAFKNFVAEAGPKLAASISMTFDWISANLIPVLKDLWAFISANVIPIFQTAYNWLQTNLPSAIATVSNFWNNTLLPALNAIWAFIQANVVPIFETLAGKLNAEMPGAITTLVDFWNNTLKPALTAIWEFLSVDMLPIWTALNELIGTVVVLAFEALALAWEAVLKPAFDAIWKLIKDYVLPAFKSIAENETLKAWINTIAGAIGWLIEQLQAAVEWFRNLRDARKSSEEGGTGTTTPTPRPRQFGGPVMSGMPYIVGEAGPELFVPRQGGMIINNYNLTANYQNRDRQSLAMDIKMLAAMYG